MPSTKPNIHNSCAPRIDNWTSRSRARNDVFLVSSFKDLVAASAELPPEQRIVMYDACDEHEVASMAGRSLRRRLDARRSTKPKQAKPQTQVCTPFDPADFNFSKIKDARERVATLSLEGGHYEILTNKFPLARCHMLLVAKALVPQQMSRGHLEAIHDLTRASSFCAYFNSWCASASVNHFHTHLIGEMPPVTALPLVPGPLLAGGVRCLVPDGFPGHCYVLEASELPLVAELVAAMQADNQPHNLLLTGRHIYVWPKPNVRSPRSLELYPETVGGPELVGSFTVYTSTDYEALSLDAMEEALRINTAPLPARLLQRVDGAAVLASAMVLASRSLNRLPCLPPLEPPPEPWAQEPQQEPWTVRGR